MRFLFTIFRVLIFLLICNGVVQAQTIYTWNGAVGNWDTPAEWTPPSVPGLTDTAIINSGTVTLGSEVNIGGVVLNGGTIIGSGKLTISGIMRWTDGILGGNGSTDSTIIPQGAKLLAGGTKLKELEGRTLIIQGELIWSGIKDIQFGSNAKLVIESTGRFDIQSDANLSSSNTGGSILNNGVITKSLTGGSTQIEVLFDNRNVVNINTGEIRIISGGSVSTNAVYHTVGNAVMRFSSGNHAFNAVHLTGGGTVQFVDPVATLTGGGLIIDSGALLTMAGSGSILQGDAPFSINGTFDWGRGTIIGLGTLLVDGHMIISGNSAKLLDGQTISNRGTLTWTGAGEIRMFNGAKIVNKANAMLDIQSDAQLGFFTPGGGSLENAGTLIKSDGLATGQTNIDIPWQNTGTVQVFSGRLQLQHSSDFNAGMLEFADSTSLIIKDGAHNFAPGVTLANTGLIEVKGGITTFSGALTGNPEMKIVSGEFVFNSSNTLGRLTQTKGTLVANGNVNVLNTFNWVRGTITGSGGVTASGLLSLTGGNSDIKTLDGGTLLNTQTANWSGTGDIRMANDAILLNPAGAIFNIFADANIDQLFAAENSGIIRNHGIINKSNNSGTINIEIFIENFNRINIESGILKILTNTVSQNGLFTIAGGAEFAITGGSHAWTNVVLTGAGFADFNNLDLRVEGQNGLLIDAPTTLTLRGSGTVLHGDGPVNIDGVMNWERGLITGSGAFNINNTFNISGGNNRVQNGRRFNNNGTINWSMISGKWQVKNGAEILNRENSRFNIQSGRTLEFLDPNGGKITNYGVISKTADSGPSVLQVDIDNFGALEFFDTLAVSRALTNQPFATIRGSSVLDISLATFTNNGVIEPGASPGILEMIGGYPASTSATVNIELGGATVGSEHDLLDVSGFMALDGSTLNLSLINGYTPAPADTLEIMRYGFRSGQFSAITGIDTSAFEITYTPSSMLLTNFSFPANAPPVAQNDDKSTDEDTPLIIDVLQNDSDPENNPLSITEFSQAHNGAVSQTSDDKLRYTPAANFFGADSFNYSIADGLGGSGQATVIITVNSVNDLPVIFPQLPNVAIKIDSSFSLDLDNFAVDADHPDSQLTWQARVLSASNKSAIIDTSDLQIMIDSITHVATITATADSFGVFSVKFSVHDPENGADSDTISVSVQTNTPVLLTPLQDVVFAEDSGPVTLVADLHAMFIDLDGDPLTFTASGDAGISPRIEGNSFILDTEANFAGSGLVTVTATDPSGAAASDIFRATYTQVEDPPDLTDFPGFIRFWRDSTVVLDVWDLVEDPESPDSALSFDFSATNPALLRNYNANTGILQLSTDGSFFGDVIMTVTATDTGSLSSNKNVTVRITEFNSIEALPGGALPKQFTLSQNFPNPFNPETRIRFQIPKAGPVKLIVYNLLGQKMRTLADRRMQPGIYDAVWDGRDDRGNSLASGVYFYRFTAGDFQQVKKMLLIR